MTEGRGHIRTAAKAGAFVVSLVLALSVASIAFAANTATFSGATPRGTTTVAKPTISVVVYDKYGVTAASGFSMTVGGSAKAVTMSRYGGWGTRKFKLSYAVPADLARGTYTVAVRVHDLKHKTSTYSWTFTVADGVAPGTTSNAVLNYIGSFGTIALTAADNDGGTGVAATYYKVDGGTTLTYSAPITVPIPEMTKKLHRLDFWSSDVAGNVESVKTVYFFVERAPTTLAQKHVLPVGLGCTQSGCHGPDLISIHSEAGNGKFSAPKGCAVCHSTADGTTPSATCTDCHENAHAVHLAITSTSSPACSGAGCHGSNVSAIHANCAMCHAASAYDAIIAAGNAHCESCHFAGGLPVPVHDPIAAHALGGGGCFGSSGCHAYTDAAAFHNGTPSGCRACHTGTTAATVAATVGWANRCALVGCHPDLDATHDEVFGYFNAASASSHADGVKTKFDGSQGTLLKDSLENTVTSTWEFPEKNVFWAADAITTGEAPASAKVGLTKDSVVTCFDCHSGDPEWFSGPHGSSARWAIDSNYPGPYKYAVLGARKGTTEDTSTSGIKSLVGAAMNDAPGRTLTVGGAEYGPLPLLQTYRNKGNFPALIADGTKGDHAVICAKCHDLYNAGTGTDGWSNAYSEQATSGAPIVLEESVTESVHGMHAGGTTTDTQLRFDQRGGNQGRTDGRGDCINCHVAIPHGWKRPRLLVNSYTGPYTLATGTAQSVADPFPYWQGRGQFISEGNSPGNGPIDAVENHELNVDGVPVWSEQACISCSDGALYESGGTEENGLEHKGFIDRPAKLK
jgi:hypothetical protein